MLTPIRHMVDTKILHTTIDIANIYEEELSHILDTIPNLVAILMR